jgi:hypothetical protein
MQRLFVRRQIEASLWDCSNGCGVSSDVNKKPFGSIRIDHIDAHVKKYFAPIGSLGDNG